MKPTYESPIIKKLNAGMMNKLAVEQNTPKI